MKKTLLYSLSVMILPMIIVIGIASYTLFTPVISQESGVTYYLKPGTAKKTLVADLTQQGIISSPSIFSLYVYTERSAYLKTGEYLFPKGSTLISIWKQVTTGTGLVYHPFTIIPGNTFSQLRQALAQTAGLRHITSQWSDMDLMARLGNSTIGPEGEFFPETYYYTKGIPDLVILKRAFDLMQSKMMAAWENRAQGLPYKNAYEALVAASLIEKEAYLDSERPIIAGVLVNRLRKDMLLQFDPTVIYGMGTHYDGKIHKENLQEDTPYNTYIHKGLPPTPIAMPSIISIDSAMHPQINDYYYFVAKGDGSHQFSKTLIEHNAAVKAVIKQDSHFNEAKVGFYIQNHFVEALKKSSQNVMLSNHSQSL